MTIKVTPQECRTMEVLRSQIDRIDEELISLLAERAGYIDRAIDLKKAEGLPAHIPDRVEEVVSHARAFAGKEGLDPDLIETMWRVLIQWSIDREAQVIRRE